MQHKKPENHTNKFLTCTIVIMTLFFASINQLFAENEKPSYEIAEVYSGLRNQILTVTDKDVPELKGKSVWAVIMETGHDEVIVTLVAVAEGSTSLYFSNGGGMIGLGEYENVHPAVLSMVETAKPQLKHMEKTQEFPNPKHGETLFYVVTPDGIFTYSAQENDLGYKRDKLFPLFHKGHDLIAEMRIAYEKEEAKQDNTEKK